MAEYHDVKSQFDEENQRYLKRLFKSPFFHKFVLTDTVNITRIRTTHSLIIFYTFREELNSNF